MKIIEIENCGNCPYLIVKKYEMQSWITACVKRPDDEIEHKDGELRWSLKELFAGCPLKDKPKETT